MTQRSKPQIQNKVARLWATGTSKAGVAKRPREGLHKSVHREERSDAAIHKWLIGKQNWIASLRSQ